MIILLFGQPASGKTTLANELLTNQSPHLRLENIINIDGDKWRAITKNKDYSKEGRFRNLKGAFDMALYLEKEGYTPILSFVTPYQELRDYLKLNAKDLIQVHLTYHGDRGRNDRFAADFELPDNEIVTIDTSKLSILKSVRIILEALRLQLKLKKNVE